MNKIGMFLIFLSIVSSIYFGMHYYIFKRLIGALQLSDGIMKSILVLFIVGGVSFIGGEILSRKWGLSIVLEFGVYWLGLIAIAFFFTFLKDLVIWITPLNARTTALTAMVCIVLVTFFSVYNGLREPRLRTIDIPLKKPAPDLNDLKIVQLSDMHLNGVKSVEWLDSIVSSVNEQTPDIIVFTGDLIDRDYKKIKPYVPALQRLQAPLGLYSIPGNHEFYAGTHSYKKFIEECNITDISNEVLLIDKKIQLAGLPDPEGKRFGEFNPDLEVLLSKIDSQKPLIFLAHRPENVDKIMAGGADLMLSGHTHAGQIPPMDIIVKLVYRYSYGLYEHENGWIYTTCGTGTWGPPMRFLSRSEIALFVLKSPPQKLD